MDEGERHSEAVPALDAELAGRWSWDEERVVLLALDKKGLEIARIWPVEHGYRYTTSAGARADVLTDDINYVIRDIEAVLKSQGYEFHDV